MIGKSILWKSMMPLEHQKLVFDRIQKSKKNPSRLLDWDQASKSLKP
jgi:hypothetical protein